MRLFLGPKSSRILCNGHFELPGDKRSKFEPKEKKFSLVLKMEVCDLKTQQICIFSTKLNFFPSSSNLTFLRQATQGDYCISLNSCPFNVYPEI